MIAFDHADKQLMDYPVVRFLNTFSINYLKRRNNKLIINILL